MSINRDQLVEMVREGSRIASDVAGADAVLVRYTVGQYAEGEAPSTEEQLTCKALERPQVQAMEGDHHMTVEPGPRVYELHQLSARPVRGNVLLLGSAAFEVLGGTDDSAGLGVVYVVSVR